MEPEKLEVGDMMLGCYIHGTVARISPRGAQPNLRHGRREHRGGGTRPSTPRCV